MPRRRPPLTIEEAVNALEIIHCILTVLLRGQVGANTRVQLNRVRAILVRLLERQYRSSGP